MDDLITGNEDFKSMSEQEKKEFINNLIHSEAAFTTKAAFFNPKTKKAISLTEMMNELGEEKVIELLMHILDNSETQTVGVSGNEFEDLIKRRNEGKCTEEELLKLEMIEQAIGSDNETKMKSHLIGIITDMIGFAQNEIGYYPTLFDLYSAIGMLTMIDLVKDKNSALSIYDGSNMEDVMEIGTNIGEDILDTWKKSCTSKVNDETILLGLIYLIQKIAHENQYTIVDSEILNDIFGKYVDESEDGSNDEDEEMRDLLKD